MLMRSILLFLLLQRTTTVLRSTLFLHPLSDLLCSSAFQLCAVWEVVHGGQTPFRHCSHSTNIMQLVLAKERPAWQANAPTELITLAEQCWAADPADRPSISTVCEQLLQMQLAMQLQQIDMQGWPSGPWIPPAADDDDDDGRASVVQQAGSSAAGGNSRRGSGSSSTSTGVASFYDVAAAAVAQAAAAEAAGDSDSNSGTAAAAAPGRLPVRKSVSFTHASPAASAAGGLQAIPEAVTPRATFQRSTGSSAAAAAAAAATALPSLRLPLSAGAVLQSCNGSYQTLDQVLQAGLNPANSMGSSQAASAAAAANPARPGTKQNMVRRHSVAHVDFSASSCMKREQSSALQALRGSDAGGDATAAAAGSTGADVSEMQAFENMLVTGRKAFARGVDCSALDVLGSQDAAGKQSGSAWPAQQQQQQWRLSGSGAGDDGAQRAVSAGDAIGPMVGYWD
jgi:hypothetical protein